MTKHNRFSIVIPTYNGQNLLNRNLPQLIKIFPQVEIIVVDDGSVDKTQSVLSKLKIKNDLPADATALQAGRLKIIRNKRNCGFASSANRGILAAKTPLVFLLNNDCVPKNNFINLILPYFQDKKTFAVSCLEKTNGRARGRGVGGFRKGLLLHKAGKLDKNNTLWAFGAATIYNKAIFVRLGGFDENFNPFYWEDFDLSYRALKSGYNIYFEKRAVIDHQPASTINKYYSVNQINQISFRNQLLTCWKNLTDQEFIIKHFFWLAYHLIMTTIKTRGDFFMGFLKALLKLKKILIKRKQNRFVLTDKEVLAPFQKEILN